MGEAESNAQCIPCAVGSYSLVPGASCKNCPEEAYCYGNYSIASKNGYWQVSTFSDMFFACPYKAACITSSLNRSGTCAEGYEGNMCQSCSVGYFRWSCVRCSKCPNSTIHTVGQLAVWLVILILCVLLINLSLKIDNSESTDIKIFLNYLQLVMLFDSFNLAWPELMLQLFNAQEAVGGFPEFLFSFTCLYEEETELQAYQRKWIILSLLPILLLAVSTAVWTCVSLCHKSRRYLQNQAVGSGIALFFVVFPSVMRAMLGVLHCREIFPGQFWVLGLDMRCWTSEHLKYAFGLAVPSMVLWGLAGPALTFLLIRRQKHQFQEAWFKVRYGFLTAGYQSERFYWEYVIIYRKLLIIAFIVFFAQASLFLQVLSTLDVLLVSVLCRTGSDPTPIQV